MTYIGDWVAGVLVVVGVGLLADSFATHGHVNIAQRLIGICVLTMGVHVTIYVARAGMVRRTDTQAGDSE